MRIGSWKFSLMFAWYDMWVGAFYDKKGRKLYLFPIPMFGLKIQFGAADMPGMKEFTDSLILKCNVCVWARACAACHLYFDGVHVEDYRNRKPYCYGTKKVMEVEEEK